MKNQSNATVYISNLSYDRDRRGVRTLFSRYGTIVNIKIIVEPKSLQSRGMAFVEMSSIAEAEAAIAGLNGEVIDGRTIKANFAIPQDKPSRRPATGKAKSAAASAKGESAKPRQDIDFKSKQLAKKARNDAKRSSNPLNFKTPLKKVAKKTVKKVAKKG